jgi:hypothetical protein
LIESLPKTYSFSLFLGIEVDNLFASIVKKGFGSEKCLNTPISTRLSIPFGCFCFVSA